LSKVNNQHSAFSGIKSIRPSLPVVQNNTFNPEVLGEHKPLPKCQSYISDAVVKSSSTENCWP